MKSSFQLKGLENYLEDIAKAGEDVDQVVKSVLFEASKTAEGELYANLRRSSETWTGATEKTLFASGVQQDGNYIFFELGADVSTDPSALYKEYGTSRQAAEPFLRPAFTSLRHNGIKRMLKAVFERMGIATS